jgi:alkanesulfonate monooxygenase SsuD/methylene tetrahydromethanopterin reductase-like flavin-dependent oxidoreductase (luciferase family)
VTPKLLLVLSENWAITAPDDLRALVRIAVEAEQAGIDGVMLSEHVVLGPSAGAAGVMANPRDYAAPGNQPPDTSWPSSVVLLSGGRLR